MKLGINIGLLKEEYVKHILDLGVDSILLAFHLGLPDKRLLGALIKEGVEISARYVPTKREQGRDLSLLFNSMVGDYKGYVHHWEFGGEPDVRQEEGGCRWFGTPEEYAKMLIQFSRIVKAKTDATVGTGSFFSGSSYGLRETDNTEFIYRLFRCDINGHVDTFSLVLWTRYYGGTQQLYPATYRFAGIMNLHQIIKPLTAAEFGSARNEAGDTPYMAQEQADDFIKAYVILRHLGYEAAYYFKLEHMMEGTHQHWGLLDADGRPTETYATFKKTQETFKDATLVKRVSRGIAKEWWKNDYIYWYIFERNGYWLHVIWHDLENPIKHKDIQITRKPAIIRAEKGEML